MRGEFEFLNRISIGTRIIGENSPTFIIAEVGINHNGDLDIAKESIYAAAKAGADCVKFQTFRADEFMADKSVQYEYVSSGVKVTEAMYDMFKRLEMPLFWHLELQKYCKELGVEFLTSVADPLSMKVALDSGVRALKLASEDLINHRLIMAVADIELPLILSTGMSSNQELFDVIDILERKQKKNVIFLHCVSLYPTKDEEANLKRMVGLSERTSALVGYSDHTIGPLASIGAVALGAKVIEKHFTLDRSLAGPDHSFSSNPSEFKEMVSKIRAIERLLGNDYSEISGRELSSKQQFRRSIVATRDLIVGSTLSEGDIAARRPEGGIHPRELHSIVGKKVKTRIEKNQQIKWEMLEE